MVDAPGEPPPDGGYELLLDPDHPERSLVLFHAAASEAYTGADAARPTPCPPAQQVAAKGTG